VPKAPKKRYDNQTLGNLANTVIKQENRLKKLEDSSACTAWEHHFNQKPFIVISGLVVIMFGGFWAFYTYQIDRFDKQNIESVNKIKSEYESRIKWLNEKNESTLATQIKDCAYDKKIAKNNCTLKQPLASKKKLIK